MGGGSTEASLGRDSVSTIVIANIGTANLETQQPLSSNERSEELVSNRVSGLDIGGEQTESNQGVEGGSMETNPDRDSVVTIVMANVGTANLEDQQQPLPTDIEFDLRSKDWLDGTSILTMKSVGERMMTGPSSIGTCDIYQMIAFPRDEEIDIPSTKSIIQEASTEEKVEGLPWGWIEGSFGLYTTTDNSKRNPEKLRPYLAWRPLDIVKRTLERTTQLATMRTMGPMRRHIQSRFPALNHRRIHEVVATDTMFSSKKDVSGSICAQIFYGRSSHYINVYGLRMESDGHKAYDDFCRQEGIPSIF
jgi:hypothetical protein